MPWATTEPSHVWCSTRISPNLALTALLAAAIGGALWFRPAAGPGPFARDFEAYYAAGATWNAGGNPYSRDVWEVERTIPGVDASRDEVLPFVGPAAALPFWSLVARVPFDTARAGWEIGLCIALCAIVAGSLAVAGVATTRPRALAALALAGTSGPVLSALTLGQAALIGAAGTLLAFVALERRSRWAIPAAFVAAIQPNLALPLAVRAIDRRALFLLACAAAAFVAITLAVGGGIDGFVAYLHLLRAHGDAERFITIQHTLPALAAAFGAPHALAGAIGAAAALAACAVVVIAAIRLRAQPALAACIGVALLPFAVPFFHEHDFAIDLLPVLVLLQRGDARVRAIAGCAAVLTLVDWFGFAQRPQATLQIACLAIAVAVAVALFATPRFVPLVTVAAVAAVCIPLAHAFVAPTWPETLGPYHAAPGADISSIWRDEGVRSGLAAVVPAWSVLRAIPLFGCILLAYASALVAAPAYATNTAPSRIASGIGASDSPLQGPVVQ